MPDSFRSIDYSLRPAKYAERKVLVEVFRHLGPFQPLPEYAYAGLGSVWFSDFILFHKTLGVTEMISMERSTSSRQRFIDNKPFSSVKIDFRPSQSALPDLDWSKRQLVWLDYDDPLTPEMLVDAQIVANRARSGSVVVMSVQCQRAREAIEAEKDPTGPGALERFSDTFGRARIPADTEEDDLFGWPFGKISRTMIFQEIEGALGRRNGSLIPSEQLFFHKICTIEYQDGARMTSIVGVFCSESEKSRLEQCRFEQLDFIKLAGSEIRIKMPLLTIREMRRLEQQLPCEDIQNIDIGAIPSSEANSFAKMYRYLPNFGLLEG